MAHSDAVTGQALSDADRILAMIRSHSSHGIARLDGWVLLARAIDPATGQLTVHTLVPNGQTPFETAGLLSDGGNLLPTD